MTKCRIVTFEDNDYYVCKYDYKDKQKLFIIDADEYVNVLKKSYRWHKLNNYIGFSKSNIDGRKHYYLHNIVMNKPHGGGKGQKYTIDHINKNTHDNRKVNLRLITQSRQNENQKTRSRTINLPKDCGIDVNDIPRCVYYKKAYGHHGDRFIIELKNNCEKKKTWQSTSSVKVSLFDKFIEIKKILFDISKEYPELVENKAIFENYSDESIKLLKEFNEIIKLSKYKCVKDNLVKIPKKKVLKLNIKDASKSMKKYLESNNTSKKTGRRHKSSLPKNCKITTEMIPKYCYYTKESEKRGDYFTIDRHPLLKETRMWHTTTSKKVNIRDKFNQLKTKLKELVPKRSRSSGSKTSRKIVNK